ncbi:CPBP family intramembrane glutamic endopeptidase [Ktedonospora formicarum]|uniref:CAAX amino protease n=1 Tax=Ktedonospora formicarum TaxID=2778364 RepID=A0A8J3I7S5_9CHLR|nr:CPBP family intramembrane glutamic endopeptidase [Ktedonospora formicarum]GHO46954.1 CAAX amino protease [Ktedonospora formicarum]
MLSTTHISPRRTWLQNHSLLAYFLLAFGISWLFELPITLSQSGIGLLPYHLPPLLTSLTPGVPLGPTGAAFILTALLEGKPGVIRLLKRYIQWRVSLKWYLLILLGCPLLLALAVSLFSTPRLQNLPTFLGSYLMHVLFALSLNWEEGGWRGFALPRLQKQAGPLLGTIVLGILWGIWHLPLSLIPAQNPMGSAITLSLPLFCLFLFQTTAKSVSYTWLWNNTGGSLLIATLFHAAASLNGHDLDQLFGKVNAVVPSFATAIGFGGVALLIIILTRGTLSYKPNETILPGDEKSAIENRVAFLTSVDGEREY